MKHAKKMKLVEIDEIPHQTTDLSYLSLSSDGKLSSAPRTLSILDNSMNGILNRIRMEKSRHCTIKYCRDILIIQKKKNQNTKNNTQSLGPAIHSRHSFTPHTFKGRVSDFNMSGIETMKSSIDRITQPSVREFFQNVNLPQPSM